jgi:hypothetical protein
MKYDALYGLPHNDVSLVVNFRYEKRATNH